MTNETLTRLIPVKEVAIRLGGVTIRTLERWHESAPNFPRFVKLNRRNYVVAAELENYIVAAPDRPRGKVGRPKGGKNKKAAVSAGERVEA